MKDNIENIYARNWSYKDINYWINPKDNTCNATIIFNDKKTRLRAGILIIKGDEILLCKENNIFALPGGSLALNETPIDAAIREAQEEVHINVKNAIDTKLDYCDCQEEIEKWVKENVPKDEQWYNYYTCLILAEYAGEYKGKIDKVDQDTKMLSTKHWYKIADVWTDDNFKEQWKNVLKIYKNFKIEESFSYLTEDLKDKAKDYFGTTWNWNLGFYINTDGTLLDGSGKNFGSSGYNRSTGHRDIADLFDNIDGTEAMLEYIQEGNIRLMPEAPGIELIYEPTSQQYSTLRSIISYNYKQEFYIDIIDKKGNVIKNFYYDSLTSHMLQDLSNYFEQRKLNEDIIEDSKKRIESQLGIDYNTALKDVQKLIEDRLEDNWVNINITGIDFTGSRRFGNYLEDSDLDVKFTYTSSGRRVKEDTLFNILCDDGEPLYYRGYLLDINPVEEEDINDLILRDSTFRKRESLQEDTRAQLANASRKAGPYKDQSRGKNRWERKKYSKVANQVKAFNDINMNEFFKQDILQVQIPVQGETDNYTVTIKMEGIVEEIARNIKMHENKLEFRTILQSITKIFNSTNIFVKCTCADFNYRFDHWSIVNNWGVNDSAHDPGPGRGIANPNNDKGKGCKHILLTIANGDWIIKLSSVINNYINYMAEHNKKAFNNIIFPKLYGTAIDEAIDKNLIPEDTNLDTDKNIINTINDWAKNRGLYKKGSNKNPVSGTGGRSKRENN